MNKPIRLPLKNFPFINIILSNYPFKALLSFYLKLYNYKYLFEIKE